MMIDRIFQKVKAHVNTDGRGNFKPSIFNLFLHDAIQEKYESYVVEINQAVNRENRGLINGGLENLPDRLREKLQHFLKIGTLTYSVPTTSYTLPADLNYFDTITDAAGNIFENCKDKNEFDITARYNAKVLYPIYIKIGNSIKVAPANTTILQITYLRKPLYPKWTFNIVSGAELFNPSASDFQNCDMHESEEDDLVKRVCFKFGINLKEADLQASMQNSEQIEFNQNNAS